MRFQPDDARLAYTEFMHYPPDSNLHQYQPASTTIRYEDGEQDLAVDESSLVESEETRDKGHLATTKSTSLATTDKITGEDGADQLAVTKSASLLPTDMPFLGDQVAAANTPVLFADENFQQVMAMDNVVDLTMPALESDGLLPALRNLQPAPTLPLGDEDFERHFSMEGVGGVSLPGTEHVGAASAFSPGPPTATTTRLEESATPAKKRLGVKVQVSKAVNNNLAANNMDPSPPRRNISGTKVERRRVSANEKGASKKPTKTAADTGSAPRRVRRRGKVAIFTLTGQTVERVFNGQATTSYHCSDGVMRILADEALEEAKARTAAEEACGAVEQPPAASPKKRKAASVGVEKGSARRPKAVPAGDTGG
ncbi:Uncharacterized protein TCAP_07049 [Tolypocladium capitatum]|uniref:Uncharacterized protein n=1 Tax=Tolypocladium capitatum TaxID=45235 RepID=A0A2K3Q5S8_9HYPO|nr:Uncharacterized protein TCAP_07049 [Tolypocladium capitatum]